MAGTGTDSTAAASPARRRGGPAASKSKKSTVAAEVLAELGGLMDEATANFGIFQTEEAAEAHDEFILAIVDELVDAEGHLQKLSDDDYKNVLAKAGVFAMVRHLPESSLGGALFSRVVNVSSEEEQEELDRLYTAILSEMVDNKGRLRGGEDDEDDENEEADMEDAERAADIYRMLRCGSIE